MRAANASRGSANGWMPDVCEGAAASIGATARPSRVSAVSVKAVDAVRSGNGGRPAQPASSPSSAAITDHGARLTRSPSEADTEGWTRRLPKRSLAVDRSVDSGEELLVSERLAQQRRRAALHRQCEVLA